MDRDSISRKNDVTVLERVAAIIANEISDPRVEFVTVTSVKTSPDKSVANVYVTADKERYEEVLEGLESAKGRIRSLLGKALDWRVTPELRFFIDDAIDEGARIQEVLEKARQTDETAQED